MSTISLVFAGNRQIGLECLKLLLGAGITPSGLLLPEGDDASHNEHFRKLLPGVPVLEGKNIDVAAIASWKPDYIVSVHFPHIIPKNVLTIPTVGTLNLHPAYLPWNRGWHTPTWAIYERTPFGATLHWIDEGVDTGPLALRKKVDVFEHDTAHTLYQRALQAEYELFREAIPMLVNRSLPRVPQELGGTNHRKTDIENIRRLHDEMTLEDLSRTARALTTSNPDEAAYFEEVGDRIYVRGLDPS